MLPPSFIASFARFLNVASIVLLSESGSRRDEDLGLSAWLSGEIGTPARMAGTLNETGDARHTLMIVVGGLRGRVPDVEGWFGEDMYWLIATDQEPEVPRALRLDSNFFTVSRKGHGAITIREWYRIKAVLHTAVLGLWSHSQGLQIETPQVHERRNDLHGLSLQVVTIPWGSYVMRQEEGPEAYWGLIPDILQYIQTACNFTTVWFEETSRGFGSPMGNGTWNGLVGKVHRREADLAATMLSVTLERSTVISYSHVFLAGKAALVILDLHESNHKRFNLNPFLKVFSAKTWFFLIAVLLLIFMSHVTVSWAKSETEVLAGIEAALVFVYASLLQLNVTSPNSLSFRIIYLTSAMLSFMVMAHIGGMLTAVMATKESPATLMSFADTVKYGYQVIVARDSSYALDLELAPRGSGKRLVFDSMVKDNPDAYHTRAPSGIRDVLLKSPKTALYTSSYMFMGDTKLKTLTELDDTLNDLLAFALQKNSELLGLFNHNMVKLYETGVLDFLRHKWISSRSLDKALRFGGGSKVNESSALGYVNLATPALILVVGMFMGVLTVATEAVLSRFNSSCSVQKKENLGAASINE